VIEQVASRVEEKLQVAYSDSIKICNSIREGSTSCKQDPKLVAQRKSLECLEVQYSNEVNRWLSLKPTSVKVSPLDSNKTTTVVDKTDSVEIYNDEIVDEESLFEIHSPSDTLFEALEKSECDRGMYFRTFEVMKSTNYQNDEYSGLPVVDALCTYISDTESPEPFVIFRNQFNRLSKTLDLSFLGLGDAKLTPAAATAISSLDAKHLILKSNRLSDLATCAFFNSLSSHCVSVDVSNNHVGIAAITSLMKRNEIESLNIAANGLDLLALRNLRSTISTTLKHLDISNNVVGTPGACVIADLLKTNTTLTSLCLDATSLNSSNGSVVIRGLISNSNSTLVDLSMSNNTLSDRHADKNRSKNVDFVKILSQLLEHERLRHLNISHNQLTAAECSMIAKSLQNNRELLGLHLQGNEGYVDSLGFVQKSTIVSSASVEDQCTAFDKMQRRDPSHLDSWRPEMNCWLCCKWKEQRFSICSSSPNVLLHTSFDGFRGTRLKMAQKSKRGREQMITKTLLRQDSLAKLCKVQEYEIFRICPPTEFAFFFTVDGIVRLSDTESASNWEDCACRKYAAEFENVSRYNVRKAIKVPVSNDTEIEYDSDGSCDSVGPPLVMQTSASSSYLFRRQTVEAGDYSSQESRSGTTHVEKKEFNRASPRSIRFEKDPVFEKSTPFVYQTFGTIFKTETDVQIFGDMWQASKVDELISSPLEKESAKTLFESHLVLILDVFRLLCIHDYRVGRTRTLFGLSLLGLHRFIELTGMESFMPREKVEFVFESCFQGAKIDEMSKRTEPMLDQVQFIHCTLQIAIVSFAEETPRESEALSILINRYMKPVGVVCELLDAKVRDFYNEQVDVFFLNLPFFIKAFGRFSNSAYRCSKRGSLNSWVRFRDWSSMLNAIGIDDTAIAAKTYALSFSRGHWTMEGNHRMLFKQFCYALHVAAIIVAGDNKCQTQYCDSLRQLLKKVVVALE